MRRSSGHEASEHPLQLRSPLEQLRAVAGGRQQDSGSLLEAIRVHRAAAAYLRVAPVKLVDRVAQTRVLCRPQQPVAVTRENQTCFLCGKDGSESARGCVMLESPS